MPALSPNSAFHFDCYAGFVEIVVDAPHSFWMKTVFDYGFRESERYASLDKVALLRGEDFSAHTAVVSTGTRVFQISASFTSSHSKLNRSTFCSMPTKQDLHLIRSWLRPVCFISGSPPQKGQGKYFLLSSFISLGLPVKHPSFG
jgi:hypothetical protein